jgi:acetate---CoA ligase (ADP-forming)
LAHKSESGGVALALPDDAAVADAFTQMQWRTGAGGYAVEVMAVHRGSVELIMGVHRDTSFGAVVMVGIGGTTAECSRTRLGLAPITEAQAPPDAAEPATPVPCCSAGGERHH